MGLTWKELFGVCRGLPTAKSVRKGTVKTIRLKSNSFFVSFFFLPWMMRKVKATTTERVIVAAWMFPRTVRVSAVSRRRRVRVAGFFRYMRRKVM